MKALALIRTERSSDAWVIMTDVEKNIKNGRFDDNLLQAVCHCYKVNFIIYF